VREHPEEVTPAGGPDGGAKSEEEEGIREDVREKDESKNKRKGAKPRGKSSARAEEEGEGKNEVPDNVHHEHLSEESGGFGLPARGGVEEKEVQSNRKDGDLEEIEDAKSIETRGVLATGEKDHESRSDPNEEENV